MLEVEGGGRCHAGGGGGGPGVLGGQEVEGGAVAGEVEVACWSLRGEVASWRWRGAGVLEVEEGSRRCRG